MDNNVKYFQTLQNYNYLYTSNDIKQNSYHDNYNTCDDCNSRVNNFHAIKKQPVPNIFSPMKTYNINILELSSLTNDTNISYGGKVRKLYPCFIPPNTHQKTLVIDLDETLVHSSTLHPFPNRKNIILHMNVNKIYYKIYAIVRPFVEEFLREMSKYFNLYIFTASLSLYAKTLVEIFDKNKVILNILNRNYCRYMKGIYFKDLSIFKIDLKDIIILDNNPDSYALNKYNGIPILSWFDDANDKELLKLLPLLKFLSKVKDVRPIIKKIVNNERKKIDYLKVYKLLKMNNKIKIGEYKKLNAKKLNPAKVNSKETQPNNYFNTINSSLMNQSIRIRNVKELKNQYHGVANELNKGKEMLINYNSIDKINQEKKLINNNRNKKNTTKKLKFNCMLGTLINKEKKPTDAIKRQEIKINGFDNILTTPNKNELQNNLTINNGFNNYKKKCIKSKSNEFLNRKVNNIPKIVFDRKSFNDKKIIKHISFHNQNINVSDEGSENEENENEPELTNRENHDRYPTDTIKINKYINELTVPTKLIIKQFPINNKISKNVTIKILPINITKNYIQIQKINNSTNYFNSTLKNRKKPNKKIQSINEQKLISFKTL